MTKQKKESSKPAVAGKPATADKFEDALKRLEEIVEKLERGDMELEKALSLFEEGVKLCRVCRTQLDEAQKRIEVLSKDAEGNFTLTPFKDDKTRGAVGEKEEE